MTSSICDPEFKQALFEHVLSLADSQLILGHRLSEWAGHGPMPEEDIALSNLGLDLLGQARSLYAYAAQIEAKNRDEDQLAYFRDATAFRNLLLVEQPNGDFAQTMVRHFLFALFFNGYWRAASASSDKHLAAIAQKAEKEISYHQRHSAEWVIRLGDGTEESHQRAQLAVDILWPYTGEMFDCPDSDKSLIAQNIVPDPSLWKEEWLGVATKVFTQANLSIPDYVHVQLGGRAGQHTEHLGYILAQMQHVQRTYPGMQW